MGGFQLGLLLLCCVVGVSQAWDLPGGVKLSAEGYNENWLGGHATWYGDPYGEGSSGRFFSWSMPILHALTLGILNSSMCSQTHATVA